MKNLFPVTMLVVLAMGVLTSVVRVQIVEAQPRIWTVDDDGPADFHTIQEAINAAGNRDTVYVKSGIYYENVTVNKLSLLLIGENVSATIIDANQTLGTPLTIVADNVYLSGFTIRNSGRTLPGAFISYPSILIEDCNSSIITRNIMMEDNSFDLRLQGSSNCMIFNNTIMKYGIRLYDSSNNNTVFGNTISDGDILIYASRNNTISGNELSDAGIKIDKSSDNLIFNNTASGAYARDWWRISSAGIGLFDSNGNRISNNTVSASEYGILLSSSTSNVLSGNNMSGNKYNFAVYGALDTPSNWNNYVDKSNTVDGKPFYYLMDVDNLVLDEEANIGTIYLINCKNITIRNLTLTENGVGVFLMNTTNSKIENVTASDNKYGIVVGSSNNNTIIDNTAYSNYGHGIWLSRSNANVLSRNAASDNYDYDHDIDANGIYLYSSSNNTLSGNAALGNRICGIKLEGSSNNVLSNNTASANEYDHGIMLEGSNNNTVSGNTVADNWECGIMLEGSNNNTVSINTVTDNRKCGIMLDTSDNNTFFHNDLIGNTQSVEIDGGDNIWDDGYPSGGNYCGNYTGADLYRGLYQNMSGSDGIGDVSYVIDANNGDRYPLMKPYGGQHDVGIRACCSREVIPEGYNISVIINMIIINYGMQTETFNLTIGSTTTVRTLASRDSMNLTSTWNTTGWTKGNHTITAIAQSVPEETDTTDNTFAGWMVVTIPGDVNGDFTVGLPDLVLLAKAYGYKRSDSNWNPDADIDNNGTIGLSDLVILAQHYGQHYP
jgi:parallel beta-helix repeat protein